MMSTRKLLYLYNDLGNLFFIYKGSTLIYTSEFSVPPFVFYIDLNFGKKADIGCKYCH